VNNKQHLIDYDQLYDRVVLRRETLHEIVHRSSGMKAPDGSPLIDHVSYRTIKRAKKAIGAYKNTRLPTHVIDAIVLEQTDEQGVEAGYKVLHGNVNERVQEVLPGHYISNKHVSRSVRRLDLDGVLYRDKEYIQSRGKMPRIKYEAPYYGYTLCKDQNEKLVHAGLVFFAEIDANARYVLSIHVGFGRTAIEGYECFR